MIREEIEKTLVELKGTLKDGLTRRLNLDESLLCSEKIEEFFNHNVLGGKYVRSSLIINLFNTLKPTATPAQTKSVMEVACTMEIQQAFLLIIDDIMDQATTRRNKLCWFRVAGVNAINDALILDNCVDFLIRQAIPNVDCLNQILILINETKLKTAIGQMLDCNSFVGKDFKWARYQQIVEFKTSTYTFFMPLKIALLLGEVSVDEVVLREVAVKIGYLFQARDDYLDLFVNDDEKGKSSNDVSEGKCTWIACKTLELLDQDEAQRQTFVDNYGKKDEDCIKVCLEIINDLNIQHHFIQFQQKYQEEIRAEIGKLNPPLQMVLHQVLKTIINRIK